MNSVAKIFAWGCGGILVIGIGLPVLVGSCSRAGKSNNTDTAQKDKLLMENGTASFIARLNSSFPPNLSASDDGNGLLTVHAHISQQATVRSASDQEQNAGAFITMLSLYKKGDELQPSFNSCESCIQSYKFYSICKKHGFKKVQFSTGKIILKTWNLD